MKYCDCGKQIEDYDDMCDECQRRLWAGDPWPAAHECPQCERKVSEFYWCKSVGLCDECALDNLQP